MWHPFSNHSFLSRGHACLSYVFLLLTYLYIHFPSSMAQSACLPSTLWFYNLHFLPPIKTVLVLSSSILAIANPLSNNSKSIKSDTIRIHFEYSNMYTHIYNHVIGYYCIFNSKSNVAYTHFEYTDHMSSYDWVVFYL